MNFSLPRLPIQPRFEWPTVLLGVGIYAAWLTLTYHHRFLPVWIILPLGAWLVAWHGSLQHEALHGHPFSSQPANTLFAAWPLWLWLPYGLYRQSHMAHHRDPDLTDPVRDPESFYVGPEAWARMPLPLRALLWVHQTLLGRLLLGPAVAVVRLFSGEALRLARGDLRSLHHWAFHGVTVGALVLWLIYVARVPLFEYLLLYVYPGVSLTLLRSYAEHRPDADPTRRTAITEAGPLFGLLFLHNNLHTLHHQRPRLPWYALPALYRRERDAHRQRAGHVFAGGYWEQLRRFAWVPKDPPVHPHPKEPPHVGRSLPLR